ncbi:MAG: AraC family ligand binding domain-containing protein [Pyrinomonadaceae bacterium]
MKLPKHSHASACFSVLLQGTITETYAKRTLHWKPLSFGFNLADEEHTTYVHAAGARFLIIEVSFDWLERVRDSAAIFGNSAVVQGAMLTYLAAHLQKELQPATDASCACLPSPLSRSLRKVLSIDRG